MKLTAALSILADFRVVVQTAFIPVFLAILDSPSILLRPKALSRLFLAKIWAGGFGAGVDVGAREVKEGLITPYAQGVVLDLGAGMFSTSP